MRRTDLLAPAVLLAGGLALAQPLVQPAAAAGDDVTTTGGDEGTTLYGTDRQPGATSDTEMMIAGDDDAAEARELLAEAAEVVGQLKADPDAARLLERARGIYIVPDYAEGALIAGARGGEGVMLAKQADGWSGPVFYEMGAISFGAQAGFTAGSVALILMDQQAVDSFRQENNWSLDADAGLVVVDYSAMAKAAGGKGDVALWSDAEGAFAGAEIGVSDIAYDDEETEAYYGSQVSPGAVLDAPAPDERGAALLGDALSG